MRKIIFPERYDFDLRFYVLRPIILCGNLRKIKMETFVNLIGKKIGSNYRRKLNRQIAFQESTKSMLYHEISLQKMSKD